MFTVALSLNLGYLLILACKRFLQFRVFGRKLCFKGLYAALFLGALPLTGYALLDYLVYLRLLLGGELYVLSHCHLLHRRLPRNGPVYRLGVGVAVRASHGTTV